ncbi:hypothetical protein TRAPUB_12064 [Trametes pubescens]|uniref:Uncharacterized protein n=1 Tax=Trametes pubescens TaxID=154538 RepID=A0A1M2VV85_TRAPU|nr:hypothetical protein TRAPUB_12064 [Trametes pubescens]
MASETQQSTSTQSTEQRTQSTQQASQQEYVVDTTCWGSLISCNPKVSGYKFEKTVREYRIGRSGTKAGQPIEIVLPAPKISGWHCTIKWNGEENETSAVTVTDHSRNGTFINSKRIPAEQSWILRDGNEIAFGSHKLLPSEDETRDYRFIYRHTPFNTPAEGVHKDYDMLHELGKGAFATVMKALNRAEGQWYAVKIVHVRKLKLREGWEKALEGGLPTDPDARTMLREIKILEKLKHRNVCQLKEVFLESHSIYLVLELVQGGDLMKYLLQKEADRESLSEAQSAHIILQICEALAYVHSMGVAHRDLKPENVLLTKDNPPVVKVADFGLAKVIDTFTDLQSLCGTATYLAPEVVIHGLEGYSQIVDSWSVGIIAFIIITLHREPYVNEKADEGLKTRVTTREVNWARLRSRGVDGQCEHFLHGLLEYDPTRRMTMADACLDPWLVAQAAAGLDIASEHPLYPLPASSPAPDLPYDTKRPTSHDDAAPPAEFKRGSSGCRGSTRASTEEVDQPQPRSRSTLTRTATVVHEEGESHPEETVRAYNFKRKVQDRSDASLNPEADSSRDLRSETTVGATKPREVKKGSGRRAPGIKRVRTGGSETAESSTNGEESDEVPGLVRRRSPRLNPPPS